MPNEEPDDYKDRFSEDERITENLRLRSISPQGRFLFGMFALIPPMWRGPIVLVVFGLLGFLGPRLIDYALSRIQNVPQSSGRNSSP